MKDVKITDNWARLKTINMCVRQILCRISKKYLLECINSVLDQKHKRVEIILINDCSTDGSAAICNSHKDNQLIKIIHHEKNYGVATSRNDGISISTGDYIIFLDSDDCLYQGCLAGLEKLIKEKPNTDVIIGKFTANQYPYSNDYLLSKNFSNLTDTDEFITHINIGHYRPNDCWHYVIKRNLIFQKKLKFIDVKIGEDQEFVAKLLCLMQSYALYPNNFYRHKCRIGSLTYSIDLNTTKSFQKIFIELCKFSNPYTGPSKVLIIVVPVTSPCCVLINENLVQTYRYININYERLKCFDVLNINIKGYGL